IQGLERQFPTQLSGGQQQRVALARAVVSANDVVLFDEPLSNVDAKVRDQLRIEILRLQRELGFTAVYVTHDQDEAMMLGHRIAVLDHGNIAQLGTPREVYETPASPYVARFIGAVDEVPGTVVGRSPQTGFLVVRDEAGTEWDVKTDKDLTGPVLLMMRPER
ncbi:MAG: ABC transporter ATP-binding protein, partial [Propionibacteriaceae bacterium]|nr:ABC transporter ATP-binding protein [Propionibacteriaceae bacterium]